MKYFVKTCIFGQYAVYGLGSPS